MSISVDICAEVMLSNIVACGIKRVKVKQSVYSVREMPVSDDKFRIRLSEKYVLQTLTENRESH